MCCLVSLLGLICPRVLLVLVWAINPSLINSAYSTILIPLLGLLFLPLTTLGFAWATTLQGGPWNGGGLLIILIALLLDLGGWGGGARGKASARSK